MTQVEQTILDALNAASGGIKILACGKGPEAQEVVDMILAQIEAAKALLRTPSTASPSPVTAEMVTACLAAQRKAIHDFERKGYAVQDDMREACALGLKAALSPQAPKPASAGGELTCWHCGAGAMPEHFKFCYLCGRAIAAEADTANKVDRIRLHGDAPQSCAYGKCDGSCIELGPCNR